MLQIEAMNLISNMMLIISMFICGIYVAARAYKLRSSALTYLSLAMLLLFLNIVVIAFEQGDQRLLRSLVAVNSPIFMVLFTKQAFYKNKKSAFWAVFLITISIRILHFYEVFIWGYRIPPNVPIPDNQLGGYYLHILLVTSQIVIAMFWLIIAAFNAYRASKTETVEAWVRKRYALVMISTLVYALATFAYFLFPTDGLGYSSPNALAVNIIVPPSIVCYGLLSMLIWIMPGWFKLFLNEGKPVASLSDSPEVFKEISTEIKDGVIAAPELMRVIDYLGGKLAVMIKKSPGAAKGLFLVAIDKELGEVGLYAIRLSNLLKVTNNSLKEILKTMGIDKADAVVAELASVIVKNQSVFLMMAL